jgi:3-oxoadipate enol-lactonase
MPLLKRPEGDLYYDVCDIVPPWVENKQTILFLNGLAMNSDIWVTWLPELVPCYRVIRTDLRGFGRSFVPGKTDPWSLELIAQDVLAVMQATDTGQIHFVGESTGGTVGMYMAIEHPQALASLTPVSAAHAGGSINMADRLRDEIAEIGMDAWSERLMGRRFHPGTITEPMHRWFHDVQRASVPHVCVDLANMLIAMDLTDRLGEIKVPTLILSPDDSPFVVGEEQVKRLRAIPNSILHVVANSRHGVSHSHGPECGRALRDFLVRNFGA